MTDTSFSDQLLGPRRQPVSPAAPRQSGGFADQLLSPNTSGPESVVPASTGLSDPVTDRLRQIQQNAPPALADRFGSALQFREEGGQPSDRALKFAPTASEDVARGAGIVGQGMLFGAFDEFGAGVSALTGQTDFDTALEILRSGEQEFRQDNPKTAFGLEVGGGLATAALAAPLVAGTAPVAAASALPAVARFGAAGAAAGGISGFNTGEGGFQNRLGSAVRGAAFGGALGVALPLAGKAAASALDPVITKVDRVTRAAVERIQAALRRDGITPKQAANELRLLGINATLADVAGENTRGLARAAQSIPSRARETGRAVLDARQAGQSARVSEEINQTLRSGTDYRDTLEGLIASRRASARTLYDEAYAQDIPFTVELQALFGRPALKNAWTRAQTIAQNEGIDLPEVFLRDASGELTLNTAVAPTMQAIDFIKRGLDDIVERERNPITGAIIGDVARGVDTVRKSLLEIVDQLNPAYKQARAVYAGDSASLSALRQGREFGQAIGRIGREATDPEQIAENLAKMSEGERAFFRDGLAKGLIDLIDQAPDTADDIKRIIGSQIRRGRLREAFPDTKTFTRFMSALTREAQFFRTRQDVLSNSVTQRLAAEQADLLTNTPGALNNPLRGGLTESTGRAATALVNQFRKPNPEVISRLGDLMFAQGSDAGLAAALIRRPSPFPPQAQNALTTALIESQRQAGANR